LKIKSGFEILTQHFFQLKQPASHSVNLPRGVVSIVNVNLKSSTYQPPAMANTMERMSLLRRASPGFPEKGYPCHLNRGSYSAVLVKRSGFRHQEPYLKSPELRQRFSLQAQFPISAPYWRSGGDSTVILINNPPERKEKVAKLYSVTGFSAEIASSSDAQANGIDRPSATERLCQTYIKLSDNDKRIDNRYVVLMSKGCTI
jgi:hypothetical protein